MQNQSHRMERMADQIRNAIAVMIAEELRDPRIGFVTVTRVELSADLQHARVRVSVLGDESIRNATLEGLQSAAGFLRREIARRMRLRRVPEVLFLHDPGPEESLKLERLLHVLHRQEQEVRCPTPR